MLLNEYTELSQSLTATAKQIADAKRPAYTIGNSDVLHNFKEVAKRVGITPGQVTAVYMLKHFDAITSFLSDPNIPQAESIESRFADAINYLHLAFAVIKESKQA